MPLPLTSSLACAALVLVATGPGRAQDAKDALSTQSSDGRYPAAYFAELGLDDGAGRPVRDLRVTALMALGLLADGQTMRRGPHRAALKKAIQWLRKVQDDQGRFWLQTEPDWILDHAMATYALCEAARTAPYATLRNNVAPALAVLIRHLSLPRHDADAELLLWCEMCARSAAAFEAGLRRAERNVDEATWESGAERLQRECRRPDQDPHRDSVPEAPRERAAMLLLELMRGDLAPDSARIAELAERFLSPDWPTAAALDEPLTILYYGLVCYRWGTTEPFETSRRNLARNLTQLIVKTQGALGTWDPRGTFGLDSGRLGTTAVHVLVLTGYYRYCKLEIAEGQR